MRSFRLWGLALAIVLSSLAATAQDKSDAPTTIRNLEMKRPEAYKQHNIDNLSSLLAEDFVITVEDGSVYSKARYISHAADSKVYVQVAEIVDLKVRLRGEMAIVTGVYHEKGESEGKPYEYRDRLTDVWVKAGGKWQVVGVSAAFRLWASLISARERSQSSRVADSAL